MPLKSTRHLTAIEFETVRPLLTAISTDRLEAARLCLVEGQTMKVVADKYGWTRQNVHQAVERVWATVEQYREGLRQTVTAKTLLPPGWEVVSLVAPRSLIEQFRHKIAEAAKSLEPVEGVQSRPEKGSQRN